MIAMRKFIFSILFSLLFSAVVFPCQLVYAEEKIIDYRSDIIVKPDSSMVVNETIMVFCEGDKIKHGIYRDFPTHYRDRYGNRVIVGFEVLEVLKDHQPENFWVEKMPNGKRVYIGKSDVLLETNRTYTYTIKYKTTRQLGFFKDHDELYWNVTGNGWIFPIQQVRATVTLPEGIARDQIKLEAYTGLQGEKGTDYYAFLDEASGKPHFATTRPLKANEGLTIVVSFPKGFVTYPTGEEKIKYLLQDNFSYIIAIGGTIIVLLYYLLIWSAVGRDLPKGIIIPLFKPPQDLSPAAIGYISRMGYNNELFASAIINMGVKGFLKIIKSENGDYTIEKLNPSKDLNEFNLNEEEKLIATTLLAKANSFTFQNTEHEIISKAINLLKSYLAKNYLNKYFKTNALYMFPGILITLGVYAVLGYVMMQEGGEERLIFFIIGTIFGSVGLSMLLFMALPSLTGIIRGSSSVRDSCQNACIGLIFGAAFGGVGISMLFFQVPIILTICIAMMVFINLLFNYLLKAPTPAGRKLLDQIEGFKMYLKTAEKKRLNVLNPPEKTPELFEKYLPYALALNVEQAWSEQFSEVLKRAGEEGRTYQPSWYSGDYGRSISTTAFISSLGSSMSSAISSSSTAPGSGSGSGGGGSSGGGGGGGGGGGW